MALKIQKKWMFLLLIAALLICSFIFKNAPASRLFYAIVLSQDQYKKFYLPEFISVDGRRYYLRLSNIRGKMFDKYIRFRIGSKATESREINFRIEYNQPENKRSSLDKIFQFMDPEGTPKIEDGIMKYRTRHDDVILYRNDPTHKFLMICFSDSIKAGRSIKNGRSLNIGCGARGFLGTIEIKYRVFIEDLGNANQIFEEISSFLESMTVRVEK
jgi:hypothetical protein